MKYLFPCLLALPLLASCVEQDPYYERNYYAPPPARVEVERHDLNQHYHHNNGHYRSAPQGRAYHGHTHVNGGSRAVVTPQVPQGQVQVQQQNTHSHGGTTHGHGGTNSNAVHSHPTGGAVVVPGAVRGQTNKAPSQTQQPAQSQDETQQTTHGHN